MSDNLFGKDRGGRRLACFAFWKAEAAGPARFFMSRHPFASASPTAIAEPVTGTASSPPTAASTTSAPARSANPTP